MKAVRGSGSRAIGGPLVPRVPSAARTVENRIPEDDRDDTRSTGGIHGTIDDRRRSTRQEIFIQKGYFIARGVLLSLGFGTRFPTRVFSPFHACLVPLNKLLVFFFFSFTLSRRIVPSETLFLPCSFVSTIETCFSSSVNGNGDFEEEDDDDGNEEDGDVRSYLTY